MARGHNDSIGMSWVPRGYVSNPDSIAGDKYDSILQDTLSRRTNTKGLISAKEKRRRELDSEIVRSIANMNFMVVWLEKGQSITCKCGAHTLWYKQDVPFKYRKDGIVKELLVEGKVCKDCGRKYVVRSILLKKYHEVEGVR